MDDEFTDEERATFDRLADHYEDQGNPEAAEALRSIARSGAGEGD